jgi:hypothetical protein
VSSLLTAWVQRLRTSFPRNCLHPHDAGKGVSELRKIAKQLQPQRYLLLNATGNFEGAAADKN